ncbi:MAG TPA: LuxR C-terminal-related transcriptional regulator [Albitalea sp.]|uniref:helix-turn-helix transcriptional regulator n=1 Tax=Piscinibacter sp. TaxID=1903157 RepID=UPI002ED5F325
MITPAIAAQSFALTKIQAPRPRSRLIERDALEQRLAEALAHKPLVLISAPAGFGKTAAITRQLNLLPAGTALAWVAADEDDDLGRLAACLIAALEPFDLPWRTSPDALVAAQDGQRTTRQALASELLNALAATEVPRGLIVLDDAHRISDPAVFDFLDTLLERMPPHWSLLIASRVDPPLALARRRARGELAEFRQQDLGFSGEEVRDLVHERGLRWTQEQIDQLAERTQGWPAGLGLALNHGGATPAGNLRDRHVFDYLATEVLDGLEPSLRAFLLRCSVLPELTAARCAMVSGDPLAPRRLEEIERRGLFVSVRGEERGEPILCLHDLFRDCLDERLRSELGPELPVLLQRAADTEPDLVRRIGYLARAGAWRTAEETLYELGPGLLARGAVVPMLRLLEQFPAAQREESPLLAHLRGLCAWAHWDLLTMCRSLERAARAFAERGMPGAAQRAQVLVVLGLAAGGQVLRSMELLEALRRQPLDSATETTCWQASSWHALAASHFDQVAVPFTRTLDLLERSEDPLLWLQCVPLTSFVGLPHTRAPLRRYIDGALRRSPEEPPSPMRVLAHALQAGSWLWEGRVEEAAELLARADKDCRWLNRPPNLSGYIHLFTGLTQAVLGHREAALAAAQSRLDGLEDERTSGRRATWLSHFLYAKARVALILDDDATVREMAARIAERHTPDEVPFFVRERGPLPGHLAALDERWDEAAARYAAALNDARGIDIYGQAIETRVRLAHALVMLGRLPEGAQALAPVFADARAGGETGPVLFAGARVWRALGAAHWRDHLSAGDRSLLAGWARRMEALRSEPDEPAAAPAAGTGAVALSARERDVLARIASGDSNKLIARAFDLSPHTVKRHVANILDKLAVQSRGQAASWYRAHSR